MNRTAPVALAIGLLAVAAAAAPAHAEPPAREVVDFSGGTLIEDVCDFPMLSYDEGRMITTTYFDDTGEPVRAREVYPRTTATVTNLDTEESFSFAVTGPHFLTFEPDGSTIRTGTGPWIWGRVHPTTGEQGLFVIRGRWQMRVDADGSREMLGFTGSTITLCEELSPT